LGFKVYGVDVSNYKLTHPNFTFVKEDIRSTSSPNNFFDMVIAISTIEHTGLGYYGDKLDRHGDKKAIKEIFRILKNNGKFIITLPFGKKSINSWYRAYDKKLINELLPHFRVRKMKFFVKKPNYWLQSKISEAEEIENKGKNVNAVILILATKK